MRLTKFTVRNFRCIDEMTFTARPFTTLIGPNNAGKSAVLRALDLFLSQTSPEPDEWRQGHEGEPVEFEAEFDEVQDWEAAKPGVAAHVHEKKIVLRMTVKLSMEGTKKKAVQEWHSRSQVETIDGWPDDAGWDDLAPEVRELAKTNTLTGTKFKSESSKERLRQLVREQMSTRVTKGAVEWSKDGFSIPAALAQALPQAQLIPAVRDAAADGEPGKTSFGSLLKSIVMPAVTASTEFKAILDAVKLLEKRLRGAEGAEQIAEVRKLEEAISAKLADLIAAKVSLGIDPPDAEKFIGSSTTFSLDDGTPTRIARQGHGLQRALVFAMLEVLAAQTATIAAAEGQPSRTRRTVLLFEEPELFMHPHLMRRLKDVLVKIAGRPDWQVVVTTHSPFLVDVASDPCSLVIHRRSDPKQPPKVRQLEKDPFEGKMLERERLRALLDFHPTVCEAFFARHAVLVEGDTEIAVLTRQDVLLKLAGIPADDQRAPTIVSCDGKWTIIPIARLLKEFKIDTRAIHDVDKKEKTPAELEADKAHEFHANAAILEVLGADNVRPIDDTFEHVLWTDGDAPKSKKDKPYRAWKRVRELCNGKENLDHAPQLRDVVKFAYRPA